MKHRILRTAVLIFTATLLAVGCQKKQEVQIPDYRKMAQNLRLKQGQEKTLCPVV